MSDKSGLRSIAERYDDWVCGRRSQPGDTLALMGSIPYLLDLIEDLTGNDEGTIESV